MEHQSDNRIFVPDPFSYTMCQIFAQYFGVSFIETHLKPDSQKHFGELPLEVCQSQLSIRTDMAALLVLLHDRNPHFQTLLIFDNFKVFGDEVELFLSIDLPLI